MYLATLMSYMYIVAKPPIFSKWIMEIVANFQKPQKLYFKFMKSLTCGCIYIFCWPIYIKPK